MTSDGRERPVTLVFLATYDEAGNIGPMLDAILSLDAALDVLVVDDNSPDGTADVVRAIAAREPRLQLIVRESARGLGSAHRFGWAHARRSGYAQLVTLDADHSHDPRDIPRFLAALGAGADFVIGSRFVEGGQLDYGGARLVASRAANWLARRLLGLALHEYTTSYRAARLAAIPAGLVENIDRDGYSFFMSAAVGIARCGARVEEIPIHFHKRASGLSKLATIEILKGVVNLFILAIWRQPRVGERPIGQRRV